MTEPDVYEIPADTVLRMFELLSALENIRDKLPPEVLGLMESFGDEDIH